MFLAVYSSAATAVPDRWRYIDLPTTNDLNAITVGAGKFVAVGRQSTIITSPNGYRWSLASSGGSGSPNLFAVTYGAGLFVAGGELKSLIRVSEDGNHWINVAGGKKGERILGIAHGNDRFVAVGHSSRTGHSSIGTSMNGFYWDFQRSPTRRPLRAILYHEGIFVAVGDLGTVLTSRNGSSWTHRTSGTSSDLRAITVHGGRWMIGGDSGVVLISTNAISWSAVEPTGFHVFALASTGNAVIAAGYYQYEAEDEIGEFGTLRASADGYSWGSWFGNSTTQPWNGVACASNFVAVGPPGYAVSDIGWVTNSWTKATSGFWEEMFWSNGDLPSKVEDAVAFRNSGNKTLRIRRDTTLRHPETLSLHNLVVDAPDGYTNTLLLDSTGMSVPLDVSSDFVIGRNGSFVSRSSALRVATFAASAPVCFADGTFANVNSFRLGVDAPASVTLSNSTLSGRVLVLGPQKLHRPTAFSSSVTQGGGATALSSSLQINGDSTYYLNGGSLSAAGLYLQAYGDGAGLARFNMAGGTASVGTVLLGVRSGGREGAIVLDAGQFNSTLVNVMGGTFTQSGGTHVASAIHLPSVPAGHSHYDLSEGRLVSSNLVLGLPPDGRGSFAQGGGVHTNTHLVLRGYGDRGGPIYLGEYRIWNGVLVSDTITVDGGYFNQHNGIVHARNVLSSSRYIMCGYLYCTNHTARDLIQCGGLHVVSGQLLIDRGTYNFSQGQLIAPNIVVGPSGSFQVTGHIVNSNSLTLHEGASLRAAWNPNFGKLRLTGKAALDLMEASTTMRFLPSGDVPWLESAVLTIRNWTGSAEGGGNDRVFFGNNSTGLTASQLAQIVFEDPTGSPKGKFPARILANGEIVPGSPSLACSIAGRTLVISWSGDARLYSSTNAAGPFLPIPATSTGRFETQFTDPRRFFLLRSTP